MANDTNQDNMPTFKPGRRRLSLRALWYTFSTSFSREKLATIARVGAAVLLIPLAVYAYRLFQLIF